MHIIKEKYPLHYFEGENSDLVPVPHEVFFENEKGQVYSQFHNGQLIPKGIFDLIFGNVDSYTDTSFVEEKSQVEEVEEVEIEEIAPIEQIEVIEEVSSLEVEEKIEIEEPKIETEKEEVLEVISEPESKPEEVSKTKAKPKKKK